MCAGAVQPEVIWDSELSERVLDTRITLYARGERKDRFRVIRYYATSSKHVSGQASGLSTWNDD